MSHQAISRILVVDDLEDNVLLLTAMLEDEGYQVEPATSGKEALAKIETSAPNLVLLDVMMPDMNGFQVIEEIRKKPQFAKLPVILLTAYAEVDFAKGLTMGANGFFRKPIDADALLDQVEALAGSAKS